MKGTTKNKRVKNTARERAWRVMRIIRGPFTIRDIARLSESEVENLTHYFCTLKTAGYITVVGYMSMSPKPGRERLFRLAKNTGPIPPIMKDINLLYDPNTKSYWADGEEKWLADLGLLVMKGEAQYQCVRPRL